MAIKAIKTLELQYPMIQFLIILDKKVLCFPTDVTPQFLLELSFYSNVGKVRTTMLGERMEKERRPSLPPEGATRKNGPFVTL